MSASSADRATRSWWEVCADLSFSSSQVVWTTLLAALGFGAFGSIRLATHWWRQYLRDMAELLKPMPIVVTLRHPPPMVVNTTDQATNTSPQPSPAPPDASDVGAVAAPSLRETQDACTMTAPVALDLAVPRPHKRPFFLYISESSSPSPTVTPPPSRILSPDSLSSASMPAVTTEYIQISRPNSAPPASTAAASVVTPWNPFFLFQGRGEVA